MKTCLWMFTHRLVRADAGLQFFLFMAAASLQISLLRQKTGQSTCRLVNWWRHPDSSALRSITASTRGSASLIRKLMLWTRSNMCATTQQPLELTQSELFYGPFLPVEYF